MVLNIPAALHDGVYSGDMCYDPGRDDPARCFPTGAIVERGRMSGKWPHRSPGVNWILVGEVSPIGEAKIQIVAKNALGESIGESIGLSGLARNGRLQASGKQLTGRAVTINWTRN